MHLSLVTLVLALASAAAPALAAPEAALEAPALARRDQGFQKRVRRSVPLTDSPSLEERALDERDLGERASIPNSKRTSSNTYSALVALGASYTDNAHWREPQYAGSLREYWPYEQWGGRYANGKVAVEYLAEAGLKQSSSGVKLLGYAYGGSVIQNQLSGTGSSWPAAKDQAASFLSDLAGGKVSTGSSRTLVYANSGINPVMQIWNNAVAQGLSSNAVAKAKSAITANTQAYAAALRSISSSSAVKTKTKGVDWLVVGIPPLEIVPTTAYQVPSGYSSARRAQALALMKTLSTQFNDELRTFASALSSENKNGKAFFYDLSSLWYSMNSNPKSYGISAGTSATCYNSSSGKVCSDPASHLYFDTLHPVTSVHKLMAEKMAHLVSRG
ncbi:uncharacterized protein RHOBADRAFT_55748 [Rhodotorula graminis WP1]|uniref:Carbohydrate esterase family 16 protein n=1 Tax=Rhodotorula graminis (strain WP1) TaxID=578459 RepID=A0A0P9FAM1_RHOGW|nr:uncharacterized protein RHOBADRAFT_55748 [Rhodotorula graminis WP1]KPV72660.1 hypothetical protein RHOBADRAFT_55748 [Rhodotorula graminis WP1]